MKAQIHVNQHVIRANKKEDRMVNLKKEKDVGYEKPVIQYLSKSKNQYIDIESMNEVHLINAIRKMIMDTKGAEFRIVHETHVEKAYVTSSITEVEVVSE